MADIYDSIFDDLRRAYVFLDPQCKYGFRVALHYLRDSKVLARFINDPDMCERYFINLDNVKGE